MHISLYYNVLQNTLANIIIESKIQHVSLLIYIYIYIYHHRRLRRRRRHRHCINYAIYQL